MKLTNHVEQSFDKLRFSEKYIYFSIIRTVPVGAIFSSRWKCYDNLSVLTFYSAIAMPQKEKTVSTFCLL